MCKDTDKKHCGVCDRYDRVKKNPFFFEPVVLDFSDFFDTINGIFTNGYCHLVDPEKEKEDENAETVMTTATINADGTGHYTRDVYRGKEKIQHSEKIYEDGAWRTNCDYSMGCDKGLGKDRTGVWISDTRKSGEKETCQISKEQQREMEELIEENKQLSHALDEKDREIEMLKKKVFDIARKASEMFLARIFEDEAE